MKNQMKYVILRPEIERDIQNVSCCASSNEFGKHDC